MMWSSPKPKVGDRRVRIRFAWLPTRVQGDTVVWLTRYVHAEHFMWAVNAPVRWRTLYKLPTYGLPASAIRAALAATEAR